ncbi:hypothetical protein PVK06_002994 [Gossypium arboreum]|uniref:Uncharacterized protein n=1 Tax=Gossypium arboreum TaxID=29729 RepID=A0ABR0R6E1_GOSAR|nr:hypothetical protein PVK06_002994 [Gossypium arboreum]
MDTGGVTIRLQKEISQLQQELSQLRVNINAKIATRFKEFQDGFKGDMQAELYSLLEQFLGQTQHLGVGSFSSGQGKGKGLLGESPLRFPPRKSLAQSRKSKLEPITLFSQFPTNEPKINQLKWECHHFNDHDKVWTVMLHLDGKALDWHHFFTQRNWRLHKLLWEGYVRVGYGRVQDVSFSSSFPAYTTRTLEYNSFAKISPENLTPILTILRMVHSVAGKDNLLWVVIPLFARHDLTFSISATLEAI